MVDKPGGLTSHDVVDAARRALGTRRVGHLGTLDPLATGVLPLAVRDATKLVPYVASDPKVYVGSIELGVATDTFDAEGSGAEPPRGAAAERGAAVRAALAGVRRRDPPGAADVQLGEARGRAAPPHRPARRPRGARAAQGAHPGDRGAGLPAAPRRRRGGLRRGHLRALPRRGPRPRARLRRAPRQPAPRRAAAPSSPRRRSPSGRSRRPPRGAKPTRCCSRRSPCSGSPGRPSRPPRRAACPTGATSRRRPPPGRRPRRGPASRRWTARATLIALMEVRPDRRLYPLRVIPSVAPQG